MADTEELPAVFRWVADPTCELCSVCFFFACDGDISVDMYFRGWAPKERSKTPINIKHYKTSGVKFQDVCPHKWLLRYLVFSVRPKRRLRCLEDHRRRRHDLGGIIWKVKGMKVVLYPQSMINGSHRIWLSFHAFLICLTSWMLFECLPGIVQNADFSTRLGVSWVCLCFSGRLQKSSLSIWSEHRSEGQISKSSMSQGLRSS